MKQIALLLTLALGACTTTGVAGGHTEFKRFTKHTLTPAEIATVQADVKASLKDPESAHFGAMAAGVTSVGIVTVCGQVNAKNSYGGFTGMQAFTVSLNGQGAGDVMMASPIGDPFHTTIVLDICQHVREAG